MGQSCMVQDEGGVGEQRLDGQEEYYLTVSEDCLSHSFISFIHIHIQAGGLLS